MLIVKCTTESGSTVTFDGDGYVAYQPGSKSPYCGEATVSGILSAPCAPEVGERLCIAVDLFDGRAFTLATSPLVAVSISTLGMTIRDAVDLALAGFAGPITD